MLTARLSPIALAVMASIPGLAIGEHRHDIGLHEVLVSTPADASQTGATMLESGDFEVKRAATSDTATLLRGLPGVSLYGAGGLSSLPAIRGLADDRLRIQVDGMNLVSACANHMNPPLSYIDPTEVESIQVFAGISPVRLGGDSIGGSIIVHSAEPSFALPGEGHLHSGELGAFYRSNGDGQGINLASTLANEWISLSYSGAYARSDNYRSADEFKAAGLAAAGRDWLDGDEIGSSAYETQNHKLGFAIKSDQHLLELELGYQNIPYQGFPNQRMDMTGNTSSQLALKHEGEYGWGSTEARIYREHTRHKMDFGDDKLFWYGPNNVPNSDGIPGVPSGGANGVAAGMPMDTEGDNIGVALSAGIDLGSRDLLRLGAELQRYRLDDWWEPSGKGMWPNTFWNIRNGERDRYALYGEWQSHWNEKWLSNVGLRVETVEMDTASVQGYNPMYGAEAAAFNAKDRSITDHNWDFSAQVRYRPDPWQTYELGLARKTRSPNLYERFTWSSMGMAMRMVNLAGDGNGYVGNLELDPEIAHTLSIAADWHDPSHSHWGVVVTPFLTLVDDFIDAALCTTASCNVSNGIPGFRYLSFANVDAKIYGLDLSGFRHLVDVAGVGSFTARGVVSYLDGDNRSSGDNLYNMMPLNALVTLEHSVGRWLNAIEWQLVAAKDETSAVRNELTTRGYGLLNLRSSYRLNNARVDLGLENVLDKQYDLPLGGAYVGQGKTMSANGVPYGIAVPGRGRSIYVGVTLTF